MARFRFRFAKLLEIREYHKRSAEAAFGVALHEWQEAQSRAEQSGRLANEALSKATRPGVYSVWQVGEGQRYAKMLRERWEQDAHQARMMKGKAEEARRRLVEATREHQVLERLRAKHLEAHDAQELADQQKLLDDLSNIGYVRGLREIPGD